jgi:ketosteroid isomerase-like protein
VRKDDVAAVEALIRGIFRDFQNRAPEAIESRQHSDCTVWDVFTPGLIRGRDELRRFHARDQEQMRTRGPLTLEVQAPLIDVWDDVAVARYYVNFSYAAPEPASGRVRITSVLHRTGGRWLMVHHHEGIEPDGSTAVAQAPSHDGTPV